MNKTKLLTIFVVVFAMTIAVLLLLVDIFEHKQEAKLKYLKIADIAQGEPDASKWQVNFPRQYDSFIKTMRTAEMEPYSKFGRYGGSESFSRLDKDPALKRLFAGYPFSIEYNEERGYMHSLSDMLGTKRLGDKKPGACLHCHAGAVYQTIEKVGPEKFYASLAKDMVKEHDLKHPVTCTDCHDSQTMELRPTRPGFKEAMQRKGVDLSKATRQQMRVYVCAQCHVEYYFKGEGKYLVFPWDKGMTVEAIEAYYDEIKFADWTHAETKAPMIKVQHPEHELWSTGIHARSGVACADCHMPYRREGSVKMTDHWIKTPLANITTTCLTCHRQSEEEMKGRVLEIQEKTFHLLNRAEIAIIAAIDTIKAAMAAGVGDEQLQEARMLHRKAQLRCDFINAENSMGFHSPQESARILGDSIDYARQAEIAAYKAMTNKK